MRILAIIGSPRAGNTLKTAQLLEKELQKSDDSLEFEYINLWKADIKLCLGCFNCMAKGIENCPLQDDITSIIQKMTKADGIILASPVYVMNVTSNMKNFIDRLAAFCHRPAFFQQKALVLSTVGGVGVKKVLSYLKEVAEAIGMQDVTKLGLVTPPASLISPKLQKKNDSAVHKSALKFWQSLQKKTITPSLGSVIQFEAQKVVFSKESTHEAFPADYSFYAKLQKNNYWVNANVAWYKILIGRSFGIFISFVMK